MKVSPHFVRLYFKTARRYRKLKNRLKKQISSGKFYQSSEYAQKEFLHQIKKLKRRLSGLRTQLKLTAAASVAALALSTNTAQAQQTNFGPFNEVSRLENPLRQPLDIGSNATPAGADLDNDGDIDFVIGNNSYDYGNELRYFRNVGSKENPVLQEETGENNPFYQLVEFEFDVAPSLGDIDGDNDLDLLIGMGYGGFRYFENTGTTTTTNGKGETFTIPVFEANESENPLAELFIQDNASPHIVDFDNDGDADVLIGTDYEYYSFYTSVHLYLQNDDGIFERQPIAFDQDGERVVATTIDFDDDGDLDVVTGEKYGSLKYYKNTGLSDGTYIFEQQIGEDNPFFFFSLGWQTAPTALDLNNDNEQDLIVGSQWGEPNVHYIVSNGDQTFTQKENLESPFDGVAVNGYASLEFTYINDDQFPDVIIGSSGYTDDQPMKVYFGSENGFDEATYEENPFVDINVTDFSPEFIDLNGDGSKDIVGAAYSQIRYFKNDGNGVYEEDYSVFPFYFDTNGYNHSEFVDIDNDGDLDLFFSDYFGYSSAMTPLATYGYVIRYFENTGDPQNPVFEEKTGTDNPLDMVSESYAVYPTFIDFDADGDLDAVIGEGGSSDGGNDLHRYENLGTKESPDFTRNGSVVAPGDNAREPAPKFYDYDQDGDLDLFEGDENGFAHYYRNDNPAPVTSLNTSLVEFEETEGSLIIDNLLTISDEDGDRISTAIITISNYHVNDTLTFTLPILDEFPINTWEFTELGGGKAQLKIDGVRPSSYWQALLRSLTFHFNQPSTSALTVSSVTPLAQVNKTLEIQIFDTDKTTPVKRIKPVRIGVPPNTDPTITNTTVSVNAGNTVTLDLKPLISDAEDADAALQVDVRTQPGSGAVTSINSDKILTIDYTNLAFSGSETMSVRVTDQLGATDNNTITINVGNSAPVFNPGTGTAIAGKTVQVDLSTLFSDAESNLVASSLKIVQQPNSGATASLNGNILTVDYSGNSFTGTEAVRVEICDITQTCTQANVNVKVTNIAPLVNARTAQGTAGTQVVVDLADLISDEDNNLVLSSLKVVSTPGSGASASINSNQQLVVDYAGTVFTGTEEITVEVCDIAGVCTQNIITINVPNTAPVFMSQNASVSYGGTVSIPLNALINDAENNIDLSTIQIMVSPSSGAPASIQTNGDQKTLLVNYTGRNFAGTETVVVSACDLAGVCTLADFVISVTNGAPVINSQPVSTVQGSTVSVNLLNLTTDPENNLDPNTFTIIAQPTSGAQAQFDSNGVLSINYEGITFSGVDELHVRVCDAVGECTTSLINVQVDVISEVEVFNAVAPNGSSAANSYLHITGLPQNNTISIFNRWGDKVYDAVNYDNEQVKFVGRNNNGNELASGTYFYKIEYVLGNERKTVTGYLSLKQ